MPPYEAGVLELLELLEVLGRVIPADSIHGAAGQEFYNILWPLHGGVACWNSHDLRCVCREAE